MAWWVVAAAKLHRAALGSLLATLLTAAHADAASLPGWRALVVGVEGYPGRRVPGAEASAEDLAGALHDRGVNVDLLEGAAASRDAVITRLGALADRARPGDTVLMAFAGLGQWVEAALPGALALRLVPAGADPARPDQAIDGAKLADLVRAIEARGGRALLVLDAATGDRLPRGDQRSGETPAVDGFLAAPEGRPLFARSTVLASSDLRFASGAVAVPGRPRPERLLTYALARHLERDARPDAARFVSEAARIVYQLSAQRQQIAALQPTDAPVAADQPRTRGIVIKPTAVLGADAAPAVEMPARLMPTRMFPRAGRAERPGPVRIALAAGSAERALARLPAGTPVQAVSRAEDPDLIWDTTFRNVLTPNGDLVAEDMDAKGLVHVVERTIALRQLQNLIVDAPQQVVLLPDDEVKSRGSIVKVEVGDTTGRSLILFNIRSDGKVQLIYPRPSDPPILTQASYVLPLRVSDPVGTDAIVAVTGTQRLADIEKGLLALNGQKRPLAAVQLIHDAALPGTAVGSVLVFSGNP